MSRRAFRSFGIGYSSLSSLQSLAPDTLKIDRSFIELIGAQKVNRGVIPHIIGLAHALDLTLIAESVETEHQASFLRSHKVRYAERYLSGRPSDLDYLAASLRQSITRSA